MITENLQRKIRNTGLVLSLAFGFLILSGVTANAQYRNNDDYNRDQRRERRDERRERRDDRRDRRDDRRDNRNDDYYGNNNDNYGNNNDNYGNNNGNYNNGYGNNLYRMAQQYGYRDGVNKGQEDAREGHYNPQNTNIYKNGLNGYDGRGNREAYRQAYRQAFLQGFDRGYNQSRNNGGYNNRNRRGY